MEKKKFKLTDETMKFKRRTLYRIEALIDFDDVNKGDKGGWVEKEENLSQNGDSWIYDDAKVYDDAVIQNDAKVFDESIIHDKAYVTDRARIHDYANIYGRVYISGKVKIIGHASIYGEAILLDNVIVEDYGIVRNKSKLYGDIKVINYAVISMFSSYIEGSHVFSGNALIKRDTDCILVDYMPYYNYRMTFYKTSGKDIECYSKFFEGRLDDLKDYVEKLLFNVKHKKERKQYDLIIEYVNSMLRK